MLILMFTLSLYDLAAAIIIPTLWAAMALAIRAVFYIYIFSVRSSHKTSWIDWSFVLSHVVAALLLVVTVLNSVIYVVIERPEANTQFVPFFIPGLIVVLGGCAVPLLTLYRVKK